MGAWALWFWLVWVLFFEVLTAKYAAYALGLALGLILSIAGFLFSAEFDLLATMVVVTYASVFILLSLLLIQFTPLSGSAERSALRAQSYLWVFIVMGLAWALVSPVCVQSCAAWTLNILWQDILGLGGDEFFQAGMVAHELLYRFFIFETVWANVFLAAAFVVYALLLKTRAARALGGVLRASSYLLGSDLWRKRWASFQARAVHHPRRQSRRLNSSVIKHRV
jgi:NADH:ubiquinone oxidoreductase subunit 6 (subunit J)